MHQYFSRMRIVVIRMRIAVIRMRIVVIRMRIVVICMRIVILIAPWRGPNAGSDQSKILKCLYKWN